MLESLISTVRAVGRPVTLQVWVDDGWSNWVAARKVGGEVEVFGDGAGADLIGRVLAVGVAVALCRVKEALSWYES